MKNISNKPSISLARIKPNGEKNVKHPHKTGRLSQENISDFILLLPLFLAFLALPRAYCDDSLIPPSQDTLPLAQDSPPPAQDNLTLPTNPQPPMQETLPPVQMTLSPVQNNLPAQLPNLPPNENKNISQTPDTANKWNPADALLPITANKFPVQILKHTLSKRVYLVQYSDQAAHTSGDIVLLKTQAEPVMGFRVLKVIPTAHTIIVEVIKKYGNHEELQPGEQYDALEKIADIRNASDIIDPPETEFEDPSWAIEKEPTILAYDPELDVGTLSPEEEAVKAKDHPVTPLTALESKVAYLESKLVALETKSAADEMNQKTDLSVDKKAHSSDKNNKDDSAAAKDKETDDDDESNHKKDKRKTDKTPEKLDEDLLDSPDTLSRNDSLAVDEVKLFDNFSNWLSVGFGYVINNSATGTGILNVSAGNIKYGVTLGRRWLFNKPHLQDSIVLEGGMYLYKWINFATEGDSYTVAAFAGNLRYTLFFNEGFGIFVYGGALQSNVISATAGVATAIGELNSILPSVGGGVLIQIGPSWFARFDIGYDNTSLNLLLRF